VLPPVHGLGRAHPEGHRYYSHMHVAMALNVTLWSRIFRKPALPSSVTFTRAGSADGSRLTGSIVPSKGRYGAAI
jgi:hypothetical protein